MTARPMIAAKSRTCLLIALRIRSLPDLREAGDRRVGDLELRVDAAVLLEQLAQPLDGLRRRGGRAGLDRGAAEVDLRRRRRLDRVGAQVRGLLVLTRHVGLVRARVALRRRRRVDALQRLTGQEEV